MNNIDELYYSNHCPHSKQIINYIAKNNLIDRLSCICIDKRKKDSNNHIVILLDNGKQVFLPPSINDVPALLCRSKNHILITGSDSILSHLNTIYGNVVESTIVKNNGEPMAAPLSMNDSSYSDYNSNNLIQTSYDNNNSNNNNNNNNHLPNERKMDWH